MIKNCADRSGKFRKTSRNWRSVYLTNVCFGYKFMSEFLTGSPIHTQFSNVSGSLIQNCIYLKELFFTGISYV